MQKHQILNVPKFNRVFQLFQKYRKVSCSFLFSLQMHKGNSQTRINDEKIFMVAQFSDLGTVVPRTEIKVPWKFVLFEKHQQQLLTFLHTNCLICKLKRCPM